MSTDTREEGLYDYALREPRLPAPENRDNDKIGIPLEARLEMYEMQQLLRQFEKRAYDMFLQNLVKGTSHLSLGQEAVATGFARVMRPDDFTFATYRGHSPGAPTRVLSSPSCLAGRTGSSKARADRCT